jgi:hypothetical protein
MGASSIHKVYEGFSYLTDLELGVHIKETVDDKEAKKILQKLIDEVKPGTTFKVKKVLFASKEYPLPRLRASRGMFYGLKEIRALARQERLLSS